MRLYWFALTAGAILPASYLGYTVFYSKEGAYNKAGPQVEIGGIRLSVEIADNPFTHQKGLSGRDNLAENTGMLFIFEQTGKYGFWMKDMRFPLDIIWLDENGRVVYIIEDASPCSSSGTCPVYVPPADSKYVLEVKAGFASSYRVTLGSFARINV